MFYIAKMSLQEIISNNFTFVMSSFVVCVVLFLVMMIYYKVRISKLEQYVDYLKDQSRASNSEVSNIAKKIEEDLYTREPKLSKFEDEQEEKAIISYEDLLHKSKASVEYPYQKAEPVVEQKKYVAPEPIMEDVKPVRPVEVRQAPKIPEATPRIRPEDIAEQMRLVPDEIRARAIKEKPVVRENKEFLNSLVNLRSNMK